MDLCRAGLWARCCCLPARMSQAGASSSSSSSLLQIFTSSHKAKSSWQTPSWRRQTETRAVRRVRDVNANEAFKARRSRTDASFPAPWHLWRPLPLTWRHDTLTESHVTESIPRSAVMWVGGEADSASVTFRGFISNREVTQSGSSSTRW